jgi:Flp pilus assembly protein TadD
MSGGSAGQAAAGARREAEAIERWLEQFSRDPSRTDLAGNIALAMGRLGQHARAVEFLGLASTLHPLDAELHMLRGNLLKASRRFDEALAAHLRALELAPGSAAARGNLCALCLAWGQPEQALRWADEALARAPGALELRFNRGTCLLRLGRDAEAIAELQAVTQAAPQHAPAWVNLGEAHLAGGGAGEATACFRRAVAADPEHAEAHFDLALRLLAAERWAEGFAEYEWRARVADIPRRGLPGPVWTGAPLPAESTLLVTAEQGLGDTLQFLRFAPLARARSGARLVLECPAALAPLLRGFAGVDALVPLGAALPPWTAQCALLSLPAKLWAAAPSGAADEDPGAHRSPVPLTPSGGPIETTPTPFTPSGVEGPAPLSVQNPHETGSAFNRGPSTPLGVNGDAVSPSATPLEVNGDASIERLGVNGGAVSPSSVPRGERLPPPTQLEADPSLVQAWKERFAGAFTVAICWQGNPAYKADARRSVPLRLFEPLARLPGVRLVSVQKQHGREQLAAWPSELPLLELGEQLDAGTGPFLETAAVLCAADLLIGSDTAVPHLAGALGRPVWLLLGQRPDWRWDTPAPEATPWYPGFRLFRQRAGERDWSPVFDRVRLALEQLRRT